VCVWKEALGIPSKPQRTSKQMIHPSAFRTSLAQATLIFGNISEEDILLRKELDSLVRRHPDRFNVSRAMCVCVVSL